MLINYSSNITSLLILYFYFNRIINKEFIINNNDINPIKILLLIGIVLTPLIIFNLYSSQINKFLGEYKIFKFSSIHCQPTEETNYKEGIKERSSITITNNTNNSIYSVNNSTDININSPTKPSSSSNNLAETSSTGSIVNNLSPSAPNNNSVTPSLPFLRNDPFSHLGGGVKARSIIFIKDFEELPNKVFTEILKEFHNYKFVTNYCKLSCNMLKPIIDGKIEYKLDEDLIKTLNKHITEIITDKKKLDLNLTKNLIIKLHQIEMYYNETLQTHIDIYNQQIGLLKDTYNIEYNKYVEAVNRYNNFNKNIFEPNLKFLHNNFNKGLRNLNSDLQIEINKEIERYKNMSTVDKLLNRLNIQNKSNPNLNISPFNNPYDRSGYGDLFTNLSGNIPLFSTLKLIANSFKELGRSNNESLKNKLILLFLSPLLNRGPKLNLNSIYLPSLIMGLIILSVN